MQRSILGKFLIAGRVIRTRSLIERRWACVLELCCRFQPMSEALLGIVIRSWDYEPRVFNFDVPSEFEIPMPPKKRGILQYRPDFKVRHRDGIHWYETKATYMDGTSAIKLRQFHKYYPSEKLTVVVDGIPAGQTAKSRKKLGSFDFLRGLGFGLLDARPIFRQLGTWLDRFGVAL